MMTIAVFLIMPAVESLEYSVAFLESFILCVEVQ